MSLQGFRRWLDPGGRPPGGEQCKFREKRWRLVDGPAPRCEGGDLAVTNALKGCLP